MSAKTGSSIKEILQCSICLETFTEPKVLPCIHTFCCQCLQTLCKDDDDYEHACPLCRKAFYLSDGRIQDLPNNFFVDQLMQAILETPESADITNKATVCQLCLDNEIRTTATAYCFECEQYICDRHSTIHSNTKTLKAHRVQKLDEKGNQLQRSS